MAELTTRSTPRCAPSDTRCASARCRLPPPATAAADAPPRRAPLTTMFTPDHEWINIEDHEAAVVGITPHAQDALGDVVFVDLPEVGRTYKRGEVAGVVESVKAADDLCVEVEGDILEVREEV